MSRTRNFKTVPAAYGTYRKYFEACAANAVARRGGPGDEARPAELARETWRALVCKASLPAGRDTRTLSLPPQLDAVWHELILETEQYAALCADLGRFLHHTQTTAAHPAAEKQARVDHTRRVYEAVFGERPPDAAWRAYEQEVEAGAHARKRKRAVSDPGDSQFVFFCKDLNGRTFSMMGRPAMTVGAVRKLVALATGVPPPQQNLIYAGKLLETNHTLEAYEIGSERTIHLVLKLRGC